MLQFNNCKLTVNLEAQSPMIHFQTDRDHCGTTVRASEVKPKLDKFILKKLQLTEKCKDIQAIKKKYNNFFIDSEHNALNYKMKIEDKDCRAEIINLDNNNRKLNYDLYYGNVGKYNDEKKKGIISNPSITFVCFIPKLRELIQNNIIEFFIVTNFGAMQNKGFGSFLPINCGYENKMSEEHINIVANYLLNDVIDSEEETKKKICYYMSFPEVPLDINQKKEYFPKFFKEIKSFYGIMKSGQNFQGYARSYIYEYMHKEKGIDNEKAWMKQQGISPVVSTKGKSEYSQVQNPKYVRALLGTGITLSYIGEPGKKSIKGKVSIEICSNSDIERMSSPIFFKIIKNIVFIIARNIPKEIYGKSFTFKNDLWGKSGCLYTPNEFDIDDFLEKYVEYYNKELGKRIDITKKRKVKKKK